MTLDFVDDACDCLEDDGRPYILIMMEEEGSLLFSNLDLLGCDVLEEWIESGHWNEMLQDYIDKIRKE